MKNNLLEVLVQRFLSKSQTRVAQTNLKKRISIESAKRETLKYQAIIKYLYLTRLRGKDIYENMPTTLGGQCLLHMTLKNWISSFNRRKFPIEDEDR